MYSSYRHCQQQLQGVEAIDYYLAESVLQHLAGRDEELLFHSILLLSALLRDGHSCLKLEAEAEQCYWQHSNGSGGYRFPEFEIWKQKLGDCALAPSNHQPLVFEYERLYLRRYWHFESFVAEQLKSRIASPVKADIKHAAKIMSELFPDTENDDQQKLAVANALGARFSIISGGPGTGKTFTVTKLLVAIQRLRQHELRIAMAAPTGKAAQRLQESVADAETVLLQQGVLSPQDIQSVPDQATTIHRLLGVIPQQNEFRHNAENPLALDLLLVDEASMVDLPLMFRLLLALPQDSILILLGDPDQLPSVSAGSVLSDLTPRPHPGYSKSARQRLYKLLDVEVSAAVAVPADYLGLLSQSRRFRGEGGIARLANQVIAGNAEESWTFAASDSSELKLSTDIVFSAWLDHWIQRYFKPLLRLEDAAQAHQQLAAFRILAVTRQGQQGVESINAYVQDKLKQLAGISRQEKWYPGCPVMVTRNDYHLDLYNGDTGVLLQHQGRLRAAFKDGDGFRYVSLSRLPALEVVYAMTIHKTQGSEFEHVGLVMPESDKLINSRELLYTAITRAKEQLSIYADEQVWKQAVQRSVNRYSGLTQRLFKQK